MSSKHSTPLAPDYSKFDNTTIRTMETFTGPPALQMLEQSGLFADERAGLAVLDSAAGAGVVTALIKAKLMGAGRVRVTIGDLEETMVQLAKKRIEQEGWEGVEAEMVDAQDMSFPSASFDYLFINFGIQLFPSPSSALSSAARVLCPSSGVLGYTAWTSPGFIRLLQRADPQFEPPAAMSNEVSREVSIPGVLEKAGFGEVSVTSVSVPKRWDSAEAFVQEMKTASPSLFADQDRNAKVVEALKAEQGHGPVEVNWDGLVVTARRV
ncbi:hypothetical protein JCM8097_001877 [Rhodosporidiobolus ruineniae]